MAVRKCTLLFLALLAWIVCATTYYWDPFKLVSFMEIQTQAEDKGAQNTNTAPPTKYVPKFTVPAKNPNFAHNEKDLLSSKQNSQHSSQDSKVTAESGDITQGNRRKPSAKAQGKSGQKAPPGRPTNTPPRKQGARDTAPILSSRVLDLQKDCAGTNAASNKYKDFNNNNDDDDDDSNDEDDGEKTREPVQFLSHLTTDEQFLIPYLKKNGLHVRRGEGMRREIVEPDHEMALLCSPPLTNFTHLPYEMTSQVSIIDQRWEYRVGDTLQLRIDLFDSRGVARTAGGDEVRVWLTSYQGDNAVPVRVLDLGNGSYHGVTELKWPGVTLVKAALTYPREFLRLLVELRHTLHSLHWVTGIFRNNGTKEDTICLPEPPIPGYATACNLTHCNGGSPWFCGRPVHPSLSCEHWQLTGNLEFLEPLPLDPTHRKMVSRIDRPPYKKLIPNNIVILTKPPAKPGRRSLPPCWSRPLRESWSSPTPRGWLEGGAWRPTPCSLPDLTEDYVRRCLANTGLLLLGDSNQGLFANHIKGFVKQYLTVCDRSTQSVLDCPMPGLNSTLIFVPHSKPFNVGHHAGSKLHTLSLPQATQLLLRHNHTNNVIVVHYYVHNSFYSVHTYRLRVQYARRSLEEVLQKHPDVKIIIRGPHVIYQGKQHHAQFGDNFGPAYMQIWKEEFRGLYDRVWFLDLWDLSIAMENLTSHPPDYIVLQMVKALFGYFCQETADI